MQTEHALGYRLSDDPTLLDIDRVACWLANESYWAAGRPVDTVRSSIANSLAIGLYDPTANQVGLARWVTDHATFAWLCDVYVENEHRGKGLGTWMVDQAVNHPAVRDIRQKVLATGDAHGLYAKFGFRPYDAGLAERWMTSIPETNQEDS